MIQLHLPENLGGSVVTDSVIPEEFSYARVPYKNCICRRWPAGAFLILWKTLGSVDLCIRHFHIGKYVRVDGYSPEAQFALQFMLRGHAIVEHEGGEIHLAAGSFTLFRIPAGSRWTLHLGRGRYKSCHLVLKPEDVQEMCTQVPALRAVSNIIEAKDAGIMAGPVLPASGREIRSLLEQMELSDLPPAKLYAEIYRGTLKLLSIYTQAAQGHWNREHIRKHESSRATDIYEFIQEHYHNPEYCTLAALAERAGLSRSTLERAFSEKYGLGIHAYLTRLRLEHAIHLLLHSSSTAADIAYTIGYKSPSAFSTIFKRTYGCPPGTYRQQRRSRGN
jgi:AraC-like DNA-binding protein